MADAAPDGKVKHLRSDNGIEFVSEEYQSLLSDNAIKHERSAAYSPPSKWELAQRGIGARYLKWSNAC